MTQEEFSPDRYLSCNCASVENQTCDKCVVRGYVASLRASLTRAEAEREEAVTAALEAAARLAEAFPRDSSFDDSLVGAKEHNANQANIAAAIRDLSRDDVERGP